MAEFTNDHKESIIRGAENIRNFLTTELIEYSRERQASDERREDMTTQINEAIDRLVNLKRDLWN